MERAPEGQAAELAATLLVGTGRFAAWRWKTLSRAVCDLMRIEGALRFLAADLGSFVGHVACRDAAGIGRIHATCAGPLFWDRTRAIRALITPLMNFMGWLQGCDCHGEQLRQGQVINCQFKGCRARTLSARLHALRSELQALRLSVRPDSFSGVEAHVVSAAIAHCSASLAMKFMWVDELPYLVWQARPTQNPTDIVSNCSLWQYFHAHRIFSTGRKSRTDQTTDITPSHPQRP